MEGSPWLTAVKDIFDKEAFNLTTKILPQNHPSVTVRQRLKLNTKLFPGWLINSIYNRQLEPKQIVVFYLELCP